MGYQMRLWRFRSTRTHAPMSSLEMRASMRPCWLVGSFGGTPSTGGRPLETRPKTSKPEPGLRKYPIQCSSRLKAESTTGRVVPPDDDDTFDVELLDLDGDGHLNLVTANLDTLSGQRAQAPYRAHLNDGQGFFGEGPPEVFPSTALGNRLDIEAADFTGDGVQDLFLCSRGGQDRILVGKAR